MKSVIGICEAQLSESHHKNIGILAAKSLDDWLLLIALATTMPQCDHSLRKWVHRFHLFAETSDRRQPLLNEGGFLLRLIDWYRTRKQHQRYIETYGETLYCEEVPHSSPEAALTATPFASIIPLASLQKAPTVLPFHTVCHVYVDMFLLDLHLPIQFTLPLSSIAIRRIAHRNALRASHTIMTQISPDQVPLPPPPPVRRRINIGYVSSDFRYYPLNIVSCDAC